MNVLVTGGAGFIGSHLVDELLERGHRVHVVDDLSGGRRSNLDESVPLFVMDVRDPALSELMRDLAPDAVAHMAARVNLRESLEDPIADADVNVLGTLNLARACRQAGVVRLVFASSGGAVYGEQEAFPASEEHPTVPASPYGVSKLACEHYLRSLHQAGAGPSPCFLRLANVYGPRHDPNGEAGVVAIFTARLLAGGEVTIFGDGSQTRDFVFVKDVALAFAAAMEGDYQGPVNVGTGRETSVLDLYAKLAKLCSSDARPVHGPAVAGELARSCVDPALAGQVLGISGWTDLDKGLESTVRYFKEEQSR